MTGPRFKNLVIENFRSLRGKVVIPLDAQVVLIHGTNGMGKTSVLSALELGLTGQIAHLAANGDSYRNFLTTLDTGGGSIALTITAPLLEGRSTDGSLVFSDHQFAASPLLDQNDGRFFSERCYLPQVTLGRLLEIYDDQKANGISPLTLFVKELLGLDPLDALVEGLEPAFNVTRVRRIVPDYRRLEALKASLTDQIGKADQSIAETKMLVDQRRTRLTQMLVECTGDGAMSPITEATDLQVLRAGLRSSHDLDRKLLGLIRQRSELRGLLERWQSLPHEHVGRDQANKEHLDRAAAQAFAGWRSGPGAPLDRAVAAVRTVFPNVPPLDSDLEKARLEALRYATAEEARCARLLAAHEAVSERVKSLNAVVQRATSRIEELNRDLSGAAEDAKSLANALAGIVPHIRGEVCPVCERDFLEKKALSLSAHVAAKIASLTSEAGRLQSLASERAGESSRLAAAQRDLLSAGDGQLSSEDLAYLTVRRAQMADLSRQLRDLGDKAIEGARLLADAAAAREALILSRRRAELSVSLLPEIEAALQAALHQPSSNYSDIDKSIIEALQKTDAHVAEAERIAALRIEAMSELDGYIRDLAQIEVQRAERERYVAGLRHADEALKAVDACRAQVKKVSVAAATVRSDIVKKVFSTSLNRIWRDLFVRLAPSEQFVPAFKLPTDERGNVEAVLETLLRSGQVSGSPGAMLSQGNLNTAALTLFLALHLSVPVRLPWLVLDDPVQSMDDVHIAQLAALLRTLSKGMNRQVIIAVHERALFDYLTLELSPAFPGDSLITVEVTRNFAGEAVALPRAFSFEDDRAIAA